MNLEVPKEILKVCEELKAAGFECYLVGGCVRDLIRNTEPKDYDITTIANPEQIQQIFEDSFYENDFGTVGVKTDSEDPRLKVVEVTPYRIESGYSDKRHPDEVRFAEKLEDDLQRRDFTINAIAYDPIKKEIVDPHRGQQDIEKKIIQTVGYPDRRFGEDALRIIRAIRFQAELDFAISSETAESIEKNKDLLKNISRERIGEEFRKIIMSKNPMLGLLIAEKLHILSHFSPYFEEMIGIEQGKQSHKYDVWGHSLHALQHAADKGWPIEIRLAALLHDIAKPQTRRKKGSGYTFYGHEVLGAKMAEEILRDLRFSKEVISLTSLLVRWHMFFSDTEQITLSAVRRVISHVGQENIWKLMDLRVCDRVGMGRPKEQPYRLRKFQAMVEEVMRDPVSVSMLEIDGKNLMKELNIKPGPKVGFILHALLEEVIEDPKKNTKEHLLDRASKLIKLSEKELEKLGKSGIRRQNEEDQKKLQEIAKKYHVKVA